MGHADGVTPTQHVMVPGPADLLGGPKFQQHEIVFGPGVQLAGSEVCLDQTAHSSDMGQVDSISELVTRMEIDSAAGNTDAANSAEASDGLAAPQSGQGVDNSDGVEAQGGVVGDSELGSWSLFKAIPAPVLETPSSQPACQHQSRSAKQRRVVPSTWSSLRLAARPSPVPVSQRAQQKLMRELSFVNNQTAAPDAAVTAYIDMYDGDLPEQAVQAIRAATKLGNKKLAKVLAAMAEEAGAADVDGE